MKEPPTMSNLKTALGGMANIPQFIVWKLTWDAAKNKYAKHPVHPQNPLKPADGALPVNWMPYDLAKQWSTYLDGIRESDAVRYTHGFYFTPDCGYWFLDVDKALDESRQLTPVASHLIGLLSDCAFEWSSSGTGYHIFGSGELTQNRQIKPSGTGLELYTEGRGVAFGLTDEASGCADNPMNDLVIPTYFAPVAGRVMAGNDDFSEPREDWYCTCDDEELLTRMLQSGSVESKFNVNKPIFSDYWEARLDILNPYYKQDRSAIDAGFAAHLAFWTGCHAPRMRKFMERSALVRDKWKRDDYLDRTIEASCIAQANVLQDKKAVEVVEVEEAVEVDVDATNVINATEQLKLFKDCVYISSIHEIYKPLKSGEFRTLSEKQFNALFARYIFKTDNRNESGSYSKKAFEAFLKSQLCEFPKVDDLRFNPTKPAKSIFTYNGNRYLNTYDPVNIDRCKGDVKPFVELIKKNYPNGDDAEILTCWMAACVQNPGVKFMWSPVLQGGQGIGKTTITECLKYAVGRQFVVTPKASELGTKFNAWIERALLVIINEMKQDKETEGEVKKLVTDTDVIVEAKGRNSYMAVNYANLIFTLNDKWDFRKSRGDRRFCVMYSALQDPDDIAAAGMTEAYFSRLQHWLRFEDGYAKVTEYLATYDIAEKFNPAASCVTAPASSSEAEVLSYGINRTEQIIREAVDNELPGFKGGWISTKRAADLFDKKIDSRVLKKHLFNMGYKNHPNLINDGKLSKVLIEEANHQIKVVCNAEVIKNTTDLSANEITELYRKQQYM